VFDSRMLSAIFGPKRDEVTGGWAELNNEVLHNLGSSPSIIIMVKSRSMGRIQVYGHIKTNGINLEFS
jgi:hypothetical protein